MGPIQTTRHIVTLFSGTGNQWAMPREYRNRESAVRAAKREAMRQDWPCVMIESYNGPYFRYAALGRASDCFFTDLTRRPPTELPGRLRPDEASQWAGKIKAGLTRVGKQDT